MRTLLLILSLFVSSSAFAQKFFEDEAKKIPTYRGQHALCYKEEDSDASLGTNTDGPVRLASTSKLLTSLWAVSKLGPDYRYSILAHYNPTTQEIYLEGNGDPYFSRLKAYALMSELIRKNITTVKKLYFASNLDFNRDVDCGTSYTECEQAAIAEWTTHGGIPRDTQIKGLQSALNPAKWVDAEKNHYLKLIPKAQKAGFQMLPMAKVKFKVEEVVHAASNPFKDAPGVIVYQMKSAPIYKYLKHMNVNSMNWTADKIFEGLGGAEEWKTFATKVLKLDPSTFEINNGSGLNIGADYPNRKDNFSTCNNMIAGLAIMDKALVQQGGKYTLEDIMMVSGIDEGTLSGVYAGEYLSRSVVAKTGTLKNAATLAGFVRTQKGIVFFGLFFQTLSISQARNARDILVQRLIKEYGGPAKTNWKSAGPFLSFDAQSVLTEVGTAQHSTNLN